MAEHFIKLMRTINGEVETTTINTVYLKNFKKRGWIESPENFVEPERKKPVFEQAPESAKVMVDIRETPTKNRGGRPKKI